MLKRSKALILLSLILVPVILLCSRGSNDFAENSYGSVKNHSYVTEAMDVAYSAVFDMLYSTSESEIAFEDATVQSVLTENSARKIIYSSWAKVQTTEYDKTISALKTLCAKYGAYFESADSYGNKIEGDSNRHSNFTIRIPVDSYSLFLNEIDGIGTIVSSGENNRDVTDSYYDTEARLASATLREERVLVLLENAGSLDDILALERELSDIRYEIESLTGSLRKYDSLISYATYTLTVNEVVRYTDPVVTPKTFGEELSQSFKSGFENFVEAWQSFIIFLSYNVFNIIIFAVIAVLVVFFIITKRKPKRAKEKNSAVKDKTEE